MKLSVSPLKEGIHANLLLLVFIHFMSLPTTYAQSSLVGSHWHNGSYFISILNETDTCYNIVMAPLHEGANAQPWLKTDNPDIFLMPNQLGNAWTDTIIHFYDSIVHKSIDNQETLLIYGYDRNLHDIFIRYDGHSSNPWYTFAHGFDSVLETDIRRQIMGTYRTVGQQLWTISSDSVSILSLSSLPNQPSYTYAYSIRWGETDRPENILTLSDGRNLCFKLTSEGLDLYNGIVHTEDNDFEWITQGDLLFKLTKTHLDNPVPGRWPEASSSLLTRGYLAPYPTEVLRLIRNEIYARHGHCFSDKALTQFFHSDGLWYGTALLKAQNPLVLTEIEKLNVALIATIEKERKQSD